MIKWADQHRWVHIANLIYDQYLNVHLGINTCVQYHTTPSRVIGLNYPVIHYEGFGHTYISDTTVYMLVCYEWFEMCYKCLSTLRKQY